MGAADPFAPPPRQAALSRAQWFKQTMLWQHKHKRKKQKPTNHPTTTPLAYHTKLHIATQNVQGFADTLKLKSALNLMQKHDIDVLFLTETKSTQYYTYTSEQHLVILSGNNKDPHAGVGAIVAPHIRPYLADVVQHNSRIIQLMFKKRGGNIHALGCYAPHSGLDLETVRQPFWEKLEHIIEKIPGPQLVYVTGDFNVRFQAHHPRDEGVTGPFVYGKVRERHSLITTPGPIDLYASRHCKPYICVKFVLSRPPTWNNKSPTKKRTHRLKTGCSSLSIPCLYCSSTTPFRPQRRPVIC